MVGFSDKEHHLPPQLPIDLATLDMAVRTMALDTSDRFMYIFFHMGYGIVMVIEIVVLYGYMTSVLHI